MAREFSLVERNLREAMTIYSLATPEGQVRHMPGVSMVSSGLPLAVFNAAMLSTPAPGPEGDLTRRLLLARLYFKQRNVPWSLWLCEDMLAKNTLRATRDALRAGQFRVTAEPAGMWAEKLQSPRRPLPPLECRLVMDEPTRRAFCDVTSIVFDLDFGTSCQIYGGPKVWGDRFHGFVGYWQGKPVSTVGVWLGGEAVGVYSVGTLPQHQRRGYAEVLLRYALGWAFQRTGLTQTVLQSTKKGFSLYEHLGYRAVTQFVVYVAPCQ